MDPHEIEFTIPTVDDLLRRADDVVARSVALQERCGAESHRVEELMRSSAADLAAVPPIPREEKPAQPEKPEVKNIPTWPWLA